MTQKNFSKPVMPVISDEDYLRFIRAFEKVFPEFCDEHDRAASTVCATYLACSAAKANASSYTSILRGVTEGDEDLGDWKITVERVL